MNYFSGIEAISSTPAALLTLAVFLSAAYGLGHLLVGKMARLGFRGRVPAFSVKLIVGIDLWGLICFLLAICSLLNRLSVSALLLPAGAYGIYVLVAAFDRQRFIAGVKYLLPFLLVFGPLLLFMSAVALVLPSGLGLDELSYQITVPLRWLNDGFPYVYRDLPYSGFPMLPNFIFEGLLAVGGLKTTRLLVFVIHINVFLLLYCLVAVRLKRLAALVLTLAVLLSPCYLYFMGEVYVEAFIIMNLLAGFAAAGYADRNGRLWLVIGVLAGGSAAIKLTGLPVAAVIWLLPLLVRRGRPRGHGKEILLYGAVVAAVLVLPFYLRPLFAVGNPLYPYFGSYFSCNPATLVMSAEHHMMGCPNAGDNVSWLGIFRDLISDGKFFDSNIGWQLLVFLGLYAWCWGKILWLHDRFRQRDLWLLLIVVGLAGFWYFSSRQTRFLYPAVLIIILLGSIYGRRLFSGRLRYWLCAAILAAVLVSAPWHWWRHYVNSWKCVFCRVDTASFLSSYSRDYLIHAFDVIAGTRRDDSRTMVFFERRLLYLPGKYFVATPGYQEQFYISANADGREVFQQLDAMLRKYEIDFILVEKVIKYEKDEKWQPLVKSIGAALKEMAVAGRYKVIFDSPTHLVLQRKSSSSKD